MNDSYEEDYDSVEEGDYLFLVTLHIQYQKEHGN